MGAPGCPLLACCTASIARVRIVLMLNVSNCLPVTTAGSLTAMAMRAPPREQLHRLVAHWLVLLSLEFPGQKELQIRIECTNFWRTHVVGSVKIRRDLAEGSD